MGIPYEDIRQSIDHLQEGVQVIDREWRYVYVNAAAAAHGRRLPDDLLGRTLTECYPGIETTPMFAALRRVMEGRRAERLSNVFTHEGETRTFELVIDPVPTGLCVVSTDITDRLVAEERARHSHRMEALGQLAGGVAHDFNNQLTAILGFVELAQESVDPDKLREALSIIGDAAERSAVLTKQLLGFSRRRPLLVEPTNINAVVERLQPFLERVLGPDVQYYVRLTPKRAIVVIDAAQLENAITNLAVNARDAMPRGGTLTLTTDVVDLTSQDAQQHPGMAPGQYAVLSVIDSGLGMDRATQARIFEPFFTTKAAGTGTGLGLAMVYGLVKQMNGFIWVYSELGHGTTFRIYFPTTAANTRVARTTPKTAKTLGRTATVLVVDDNPGVQHLVRRTLERAGYNALITGSAAEARELLRAHAVAPDVAFVDVMLPGETGPDFVQSLGLDADRVVFVSGYSQADIHQRGVRAGFRLLEKPFTGRSLLDVLTEILNRL